MEFIAIVAAELDADPLRGLGAEVEIPIRAPRLRHVLVQPTDAKRPKEREYVDQVGFAGAVGADQHVDRPKRKLLQPRNAPEALDGNPVNSLQVHVLRSLDGNQMRGS